MKTMIKFSEISLMPKVNGVKYPYTKAGKAAAAKAKKRKQKKKKGG